MTLMRMKKIIRRCWRFLSSAAPTLPRPAKKTSVIWEEDDDENSDAAKAAKAVKAKRSRLKPIDEDDDDLENGLDLPAPVTVSLSLARPAKAKGQAAPKSTPTPGAPGSSGKNKRPALLTIKVLLQVRAGDAATGAKQQKLR